jgi:hypothetical protein
MEVPPSLQVLSEMLMDVLRALATPAFEIRRKILDLAMDLITPKNISEVRPRIRHFCCAANVCCQSMLMLSQYHVIL